MDSSVSNPLRAGSHLERTPEPAAVVIFGASGDLTKRKLVPALYGVLRTGQVPAGLCIVGVARRPMSDDAFRAQLLQGIQEHSRLRPVDPGTWAALAPRIKYYGLDFDDRDAYKGLAAELDALDHQFDLRGNRVYYLATPPTSFPVIAANLGAGGLAHDDTAPGFRRVVLEKPFGRDLETALELDATLGRHFKEHEIFRIDHYLGKETVQNILVLRFGNGIFEPLWNQKYVDHVQITVSEDIGIENRAGYFETSGILRDIVQNHALQLLALTAMEAPVTWDADAVRDEKTKVLRAIRPMRRSDERLRFDDVHGYPVRRRVRSEPHLASGRGRGLRSAGEHQQPGFRPRSSL